MAGQEFARGAAELRAARAGQEGLLWSVAVFSIASNLLLFTSPLYMMQVYDRVLGSRSEATLTALS
ncbi:MAG: type I secretion system permease/ATPase, partial [Rhodobacteraceae bacterium]|nr:type I secretion system permease/ATPase [Paracoccaceae bacterium]